MAEFRYYLIRSTRPKQPIKLINLGCNENKPFPDNTIAISIFKAESSERQYPRYVASGLE